VTESTENKDQWIRKCNKQLRIISYIRIQEGKIMWWAGEVQQTDGTKITSRMVRRNMEGRRRNGTLSTSHRMARVAEDIRRMEIRHWWSACLDRMSGTRALLVTGL
jgi:hypothetical protein